MLIAAVLLSGGLLGVPDSLRYYPKCQPQSQIRTDVPIFTNLQYRVSNDYLTVRFGRVGSIENMAGPLEVGKKSAGTIFARVDERSPMVFAVEPNSLGQTITLLFSQIRNGSHQLSLALLSPNGGVLSQTIICFVSPGSDKWKLA